MRAYNVAAVAEALDVDSKRLDNLLSRHQIGGVLRGRQGVSRRLSPDSIVVIRVALTLARSARIPLDVALALATQIERAPEGAIRLDDGVWLGADLEKLRAETAERLDGAVEAVVHRPRGRPRTGRRVAPSSE